MMYKNTLIIGAIILIFGVAMLMVMHPQKHSSHVVKTDLDPIHSKVMALSLDEKIGQLLIVGFENPYVDTHVQTMLKKYHVGGVNLIQRNIQNKNQTTTLISDLQRVSGIPLFIAADQEGGEIMRFNFLKELTPQSKITTAKQAKEVSLKRAKELKELGVNMNFSPVLDYTSDPSSYLYNRTFITSPTMIGEMGTAMAQGYLEGGIIPVAKHFPGYGNINLDPHSHRTTLPSIDAILKTNLIPFTAIIQNSSIPAIMTAHVVMPFIDEKPATLSPKFLIDILRNQLGFRGVVITDDLEMVSAGNSIGETAVAALQAGADILVSTKTPEKQIVIFDAIKKAVIDRQISERRIDASVEKILKLKLSLPNPQKIEYK